MTVRTLEDLNDYRRLIKDNPGKVICFTCQRMAFIDSQDSEPFELILNCLQIIGSNQNGRKCLCEALDYVTKHKVKVMTERFPLVT